jgi:hypothetical protein
MIKIKVIMTSRMTRKIKRNNKGKDAQDGTSDHQDANVQNNQDNNDDDDSEDHSVNHATSHVNALLVVDDEGYTPDDVTRSHRITVNDDAAPSSPKSSSPSNSPGKQQLLDAVSPSKRRIEHSRSSEEVEEYRCSIPLHALSLHALSLHALP